MTSTDQPTELKDSVGPKYGVRVLRGTIWVFAAKCVIALSGLLTHMLLARLFPPQEFAVYNLLASLTLTAAALAGLGFKTTVVRVLAEAIGLGHQHTIRAVIRTALLYTCLGVSIVAAVLLGGLDQWLAHKIFHSPLMGDVMTLYVCWIIAVTFEGLLAEIFRGLSDIRLASFLEGKISSLISLTALTGLWLWKSQSHLSEVIVVIILATSTSIAIASTILFFKLRTFERGGAIDHRRLISIAWPLFVTQIALCILTQTDTWIIGAYLSKYDLALYNAATKLVALVAVPLAIVNASLQPVIAELYFRKGIGELQSIVRRSATYSAIPSLAVCCIILVAAEPVLGALYGPFYRSGGWVLRALAVGQLFSVLSGSCGVVLLMTGHQRQMMLITVFCGTLATCGSLLCVIPFGVFGVACVTASTMVLQNVLMVVAANNTARIFTPISFRPAVFRRKPTPESTVV